MKSSACVADRVPSELGVPKEHMAKQSNTTTLLFHSLCHNYYGVTGSYYGFIGTNMESREHKDPLESMVSGIPEVLGLRSRMWDPYVHMSLGPLYQSLRCRCFKHDSSVARGNSFFDCSSIRQERSAALMERMAESLPAIAKTCCGTESEPTGLVTHANSR